MDWITGNKFRSLAKWVYAPKPGEGMRIKNVFPHDHYCYLENTLDKINVTDGDIIYTHSLFADSLMEELKNFDKRVVVITHNSDINICFSPPECVYKWFSQNVNIIHDRVESIPIGLENDIWFPEINKKAKMIDKLQQPRNYRNLVYMNHSIATNPAKRTKPYEILRDKSWVTTRMGDNGNGFDDYLDNIYNHKFVICPEGNGIDTHRIWECLYMGAIPIVDNNITAELLYSYFPCVIAHGGWEELSEGFLNNEFKQINDIKAYFSTDILLTFEHWKNKIYDWSAIYR